MSSRNLFIKGLLACLLISALSTAEARVILSEVMADPAAVSDAHGEFLELALVGETELKIDTLVVEAEGARLTLPAVNMTRGVLFLLCRDSVRSGNGGMICDRQLPGLSLVNGRPLAITVAQGGKREEYQIPASRSGISWENTMESGAAYRRFLASASFWPSGDSLTPGARNSRSVEPAQVDLGISGVTLSKDGSISVTVQDLGRERMRAFLFLRLDRDWDGDFETALDSLEVSSWVGGNKSFRFLLGQNDRGMVLARLTPDDNPTNDLYRIPVDPHQPLAVSEWCPDPELGAPEWVEIRNATADSGGQGRVLNLTQMAFNGQPLGIRSGDLAPNEYLVLTESIEQFYAHYGSLRVRLLELPTWPGLRNTGDTLRLSALGFVMDSVVYLAEDLKGDGCLIRKVEGFASGSGSPGFSEMLVEDFSWRVSGRIVGLGRSLDVEVFAPSGFRYGLKVFDLEGNCMRNLGGGGSGHHVHPWSGEDARGRQLLPGPYVVCLSADKHRTRRIAVVVIGNP